MTHLPTLASRPPSRRASPPGSDMTGRGIAAAQRPPETAPPAAPRPASHVPPADRLRAKDISQLEGCAPGTARRLMRTGVLGPVRGRNRRDRWIDRTAYRRWLDELSA